MTDPAIVQSAAYSTTISGSNDRTVPIGFTPTAGNLIVVCTFNRDKQYITGIDGFTQLEVSDPAQYPTMPDCIGIFGKVADGTETSIAVHVSGGTGQTHYEHFFEVSNASLTTSFISRLKSTGYTLSTTGVTPTAADPAIIFGAWGQKGDGFGDATMAQTSPWSLGFTANTSGHPHPLSVYRIVSSASGSYAPAGTSARNSDWWGLVVALPGAPPPPPPPPPDPVPGVGTDWDGDGFDVGDYDAIGQYVQSWRIQRGASAEVTGAATTGNITLVLNNPSDDRFNPANTGGPLYGKLVDGVPLHVAVNGDGRLTGIDPHGLFGGRITDITPLPVTGGAVSPTVEIGGEDALGWMGRTPVTIGPDRHRSQYDLRRDILAAANETRVVLCEEPATLPLSDGSGDALALLEQLNKANGTRHFVRPATAASDWYTYETIRRTAHLDGVAAASIDASADHVTGTSGWRFTADTVINRQVASVNPAIFSPTLSIVWTAPELPLVMKGTARLTKVFLIDFDEYVDAPIVNIAYSGLGTVAYTLSPFGHSAKLTLTATALGVTITTLEIQGFIAKRSNAESYRANNLTSQALPRGIRAGSDISGDYVGTIASAAGIAEHVVWRYGDPQTRPQIVVENWLPTQFELDLYDVIAVTIAELSITDRLYEIVGLTHEAFMAAADGVRHVTTYVLQESRIQTATTWFTLDTSLLDGPDLLAY